MNFRTQLGSELHLNQMESLEGAKSEFSRVNATTPTRLETKSVDIEHLTEKVVIMKANRPGVTHQRKPKGDVISKNEILYLKKKAQDEELTS